MGKGKHNMDATHTGRDRLRLLVLLVAVWLGLSFGADIPRVPATLPAGGQTILTVDQMEEDLDDLVRILQNVHPATYRGFSKQQIATIDAAYQGIQEPMPAARHWLGHKVDPDLSLGLFYLDQCNVNEYYKKALRSFFERVQR